MSPRILDTRKCPHCGVELEPPTPRVCPKCAGSLQLRYLKSGCLTSKPMLVLFGTCVALGLGALHTFGLA
jgi:ABC-type ATPase with predicted acetyltransferase domain